MFKNKSNKRMSNSIYLEKPIKQDEKNEILKKIKIKKNVNHIFFILSTILFLALSIPIIKHLLETNKEKFVVVIFFIYFIITIPCFIFMVTMHSKKSSERSIKKNNHNFKNADFKKYVVGKNTERLLNFDYKTKQFYKLIKEERKEFFLYGFEITILSNHVKKNTTT